MIKILKSPVSRKELQEVANQLDGDLVKAVVDVDCEIMAVGGELQADEGSLLLQEGSVQQNLWGINLYPEMEDDAMVEFDSMINVRPSQENRSCTVEDAATRARIMEIVKKLISGVETCPASIQHPLPNDGVAYVSLNRWEILEVKSSVSLRGKRKGTQSLQQERSIVHLSFWI